MTDLILIYMTCDNIDQAKQLSKLLLNKRLCTCVNIFPNMNPLYWWPPHENKLSESPEVSLIVKTLENKFDQIEKEVKLFLKLETVCVIAIPVTKVSKEFYNWIKG